MKKRIMTLIITLSIMLPCLAIQSSAIAPAIVLVGKAALWVAGGTTTMWCLNEISQDITVDFPNQYSERQANVKNIETWWSDYYTEFTYEKDYVFTINYSYEYPSEKHMKYAENMVKVMNSLVNKKDKIYLDGAILNGSIDISLSEYLDMQYYAREIGVEGWKEKGVHLEITDNQIIVDHEQYVNFEICDYKIDKVYQMGEVIKEEDILNTDKYITPILLGESGKVYINCCDFDSDVSSLRFNRGHLDAIKFSLLNKNGLIEYGGLIVNNTGYTLFFTIYSAQIIPGFINNKIVYSFFDGYFAMPQIYYDVLEKKYCTIEQINESYTPLIVRSEPAINLSGAILYLNREDKATYEKEKTVAEIDKVVDEKKKVIDDAIGEGVISDNPVISIPAVGETTIDGIDYKEIERIIAESKPTYDGKGKLDIDMPDVIIDKFPFSLPFDLYNIITIFAAEPKAPKFTIPLSNKEIGDYKVGGKWYSADGREKMFVIDYSVDIDLNEYEIISIISRSLIFVAFIVFLIMATNKLIGRG